MTNKYDEALGLMYSPRGKLIISQALTVAIETMESVEPEHDRELSNINDMRFIRDSLFPMFPAIKAATAAATE